MLYAVQAETGEQIWSYETYNEIVASPTVAGDEVFVASTDDGYYAVDAGNGTLNWYHVAANDFIASPVVTDGLAIAASVDGNIYAIGHDDSVQDDDGV
jgi:outer membrane protein assembly factor BamB